MEKTVLEIFKALIVLFQSGAGLCFVWCLMQAGYKGMWCKEKRSEIKHDLMWAGGGLILALGCFPIAEFIQSKINF